MSTQNSTSQFAQYNLREWPFKVVPDSESATIWAGRQETKRALYRLIRKMELVPASNIYLLWANFGMGKTHTLLHLKYLCKEQSSSLFPIYCVLPKQASGFLDIYRVIAEGFLDLPLLDMLQSLSRTWNHHLSRHTIFKEFPDFVKAIVATEDQDPANVSLSRQWITGTKGITSSGLKSIGVSRRIKSPEDAISALSTLTRLVNWTQNGNRKAVIMIDEFQRIGQFRPKPTQEINTGIHSYFNANPNGLDLYLSFSFGKKENLKFLLSDEILSRANPQAINLDYLSRAEAEKFLQDLLSEYRLKNSKNPYDPFAKDAALAILEAIEQDKEITPRRIMHYFNHVLLEVILDNPNGDKKKITKQDALEVLHDPSLGELDLDEIE